MASERKEVNEWRRVRAISYMIYCSIPSDKPKKIETEFMPLPRDPKIDKGKAMTEEELVRTFKMYGSGNGNAQA